jgi:hypothetical protein
MPSPEHAADLERVLTRAAEECESGAAWFGEGLPQALRSAIEATGKTVDERAPEVAFVELGVRSTSTVPPRGARVIALSSGGLDALGSLVRAAESPRLSISRLICPVAVLDFAPGGLRVREIRHGLTAADLQRRLETTLWSGPDLKEL